ncbi:hypothetical protein ACN5ZK_09515 [Macrococcoides bohemicum]|uniref:hypothetical protein n=1 Tax=Macrococcoides bohemicum TaxID=1903056 RepID=UPI003B000A89
MDEVELYKKHHELHSKLDYVNTVNLSKIKEISKRVHFAKISTEYQIFNNKGSIYYKDKSDGLVGDYIPNYTIDYIITPRKLGVCYGTISLTTVTDTKSDEVKKEAHFNTSNFNNYARFIADLVADKVVYSVELESFVIVQENQYEVIEQTNFAIHYPVENKLSIAV